MNENYNADFHTTPLSSGGTKEPLNPAVELSIEPVPKKRSLLFTTPKPLGILLILLCLSLLYNFINPGSEALAEASKLGGAGFTDAQLHQPDGYASFSRDSFVNITFEYQVEKEKDNKNENQIDTKNKTKNENVNENVNEKEMGLNTIDKLVKDVLERNKLTNEKVKVCLVMDVSSSMFDLYENGGAQSLVNKTIPLAMQLSDEGTLEIDFWYFGNASKKMKPVTLNNYKNVISETWGNVYLQYGESTNGISIINFLVKEYKNNKIPVYVLFVTDGVFDDPDEMTILIKNASKSPIFFQFLGYADYIYAKSVGYAFLNILDAMQGRFLDNASFFPIDDFDSMSDATIYDKMMEEFPSWLKAAQNKKVVKP
jgi:hypothetical protein